MRKDTYVLDTNTFIDAARMYYAFDLAPRFWKVLVEQANEGRIVSIDRVKTELEKCKDDLSEWARKEFNHAFASTNEDNVSQAYTDVINWVNDQGQFFDAAKTEFADGADGWLVAYAMVNGNIIVTHEKLNIDVKKKVPIPNVCKAFNILPINLFEMLRRLDVRLTP